MSNRSLSLDDTLYGYLLAHSLREHPDERIDLSMLPVGDGLTLARKR